MSLVYLVRNVDTTSNPIPKYFGQTWATHPGVPMNAHGGNTQADRLARIFNVKTSRDTARANFAKTGGAEA